jgi:hypothetical protein
MRIEKPMFGLLSIFNAADAISTDILIGSGKYIEGNPIMRWLCGVASHDVALYGAKGLLCMILGLIVFKYPYPSVTIGVAICVIVYGAVMFYHASLYLKGM